MLEHELEVQHIAIPQMISMAEPSVMTLSPTQNIVSNLGSISPTGLAGLASISPTRNTASVASLSPASNPYANYRSIAIK